MSENPGVYEISCNWISFVSFFNHKKGKVCILLSHHAIENTAKKIRLKARRRVYEYLKNQVTHGIFQGLLPESIESWNTSISLKHTD